MMEPIILQADEIYRPLREYCYSLILNKESVVEEFFVNFENQKLECNKIKIVPKKEDLSVWQNKIKNFYYSFQMPILDYQTFNKLNENGLFVGCCVLRYLVRATKTLTENDCFAFLATFISVSRDRLIFTKYDREDNPEILKLKLVKLFYFYFFCKINFRL